MWRWLASASVAVASIVPAYGADVSLPAKAPPYAAAYWSGCYVGANVTGAAAEKSFFDPATIPATDLRSHTASGVAGGGQLGCDVQYGNWVFGIQGMFEGRPRPCR